jgi:hypothetical protein
MMQHIKISFSGPCVFHILLSFIEYIAANGVYLFTSLINLAQNILLVIITPFATSA